MNEEFSKPLRAAFSSTTNVRNVPTMFPTSFAAPSGKGDHSPESAAYTVRQIQSLAGTVVSGLLGLARKRHHRKSGSAMLFAAFSQPTLSLAEKPGPVASRLPMMSHASTAGIASAGGAAMIGASPLAAPSGPSTSMLNRQRALTGRLTAPVTPVWSVLPSLVVTGTALVAGPGTATA